jgi:8-oxo-dGTP pyrophosphatase MutT (NUDIX family)
MRLRATAVLIKDGKILLVRDKWHSKYSLPGGEIKKEEPTISAVARELFEELGLSATAVIRKRQWDFKGSLSEHKVCLVEARGEPHLRGHEIDKFIWWDMKESIPIYDHVKFISSKVLDEKGGV